VRRCYVLLSIACLACARPEERDRARADPLVADSSPEVLDAVPVLPDVLDTHPEVDTAAPASVRKRARKQRLDLSFADHGFEGHLDLHEDDSFDSDEWNEPAWLDLVLALEGTKGGPRATLNFKHGRDGKVTTSRFGDASKPSFVLAYTEVWWRGVIDHRLVVELEDGNLVWRHARHPKTGERKAVGTHRPDGTSGVRGDGVIRENEKGALEVLQVDCGEVDLMKKPWTCESVNRVFWVRGGQWRWDERKGDACTANPNGSCRPKSPLPERAQFPSVEE
jgi:hypothetical protein